MRSPPPPLTTVPWTADLANSLADASTAIARLDARISASSLAPAWRLRASWAGHAAALRLQKFEVDEIDIISHACGLKLPGRPHLETASDPFSALAPWQARLSEKDGRHWREDLPFTFNLPHGWDEAPSLIRALTLLDDWARLDMTSAPWMSFPIVLRRMGITQQALPCLVTGAAGQRYATDPRAALLKRLLKQLSRSADDGLTRLVRLEETVRRSAATISAEHRPGKLSDLGRVALTRPYLAARSLAPVLDLTISGAGKLLTRSTRLGLLVEVSGRCTWRTYVMNDVALSLGLIAPARGRPHLPPPSSPSLDRMLAAFDAEMAEFSERVRNIGALNKAVSTIGE